MQSPPSWRLRPLILQQPLKGRAMTLGGLSWPLSTANPGLGCRWLRLCLCLSLQSKSAWRKFRQQVWQQSKKKTREKTNNDTSLHQPLNYSGSISMRLWHQGQNRTKHLAESSKWTWHYLSTSEQCHFEGLGLRWRRWLRSRRWWLLRHQSGLFTESSDIRSERHQWYKWHISYDTSDTYSNTM